MIPHPSVSSIGKFMRMPRNSLRVGLVLLLVAALYWPDTAALGRYWIDQDANARSGVLIALLSAFLLFRNRDRFEQISVRPVPWACLPLIACALASLICWRAGILTLQLFFLPILLWLALLAVLGWQAASIAGFAIGFLYFALPGWGFLGPTLQHLTAWAVGVVGPAIALPVVMSGMTASLPGGVRFAIAPECSGVDFLTIGLAIAALHGELDQARLRRRAGLIGGMILLAIVSNWVRVLLIIDIGYRSHMRSALATRDHLTFGWLVFACALLAFIWTAGRSEAGGADLQSASLARPLGQAAEQPTTHRKPAAWHYGLVAVGLIAIPVLLYPRLGSEPSAGAVSLELPPGHAPWQGPRASVDPTWQPQFVGAPVERRALYESADGREVEVVAIGFPRQTQDARIMNEKNSLLGEHGLAIESVSLVKGQGVPHGEVVALDSRGRRSLIWSVINIGGHLFGEPVASQLWYGARSLIGSPYSALFALRASCEGSCDGARQALADFVRVNGAALFSSLPDTEMRHIY